MKLPSSISLNGLHLKLIGWGFTLFHLASLLLFPVDQAPMPKVILSFLGYIALPIFSFLLVEGFAYTGSRLRHALLVLGAAVLTEPFYDFYRSGVWLDLAGPGGNNILFAYALGLLQLHFISYMGTGSWFRTICTVIMVIACSIWSGILNIPNGGVVQLLVGIFYLLHEHPKVKNWAAAAVSLVGSGTAILAIPVILCYNDEPGEYNKYIFYIAYPLVWIAAALIKLFVA